jgi:LPS-assembly protein
MVGTVMLGASADYVAIAQDSTAPGASTRAVPRAAIELRWPWARRDGRTSQLIEPMAQLIWSGTDPRATPNEDSVLTEFDEANLFDLNRFTGRDRVEQGARANIGLRYARTSASGWDMGFTIGRVISDQPNPDFAPSSGLDTRLSDWLASVQLDMPNGISLVQRAQFENSLTVNKAALRLGWQVDNLNLASTYTWLRADATVGRPKETSELLLTSSYTFPSDWNASFAWQYDLTADSTRAAGIGFAYRTECITVDLSLSRRFTSSANVQATTDFGLVVSLDGIGNRPASRSARRSCNG